MNPPQARDRRGWQVLTAFLMVSAGLGAATLFLLASASANTELFAKHYPLLLAFNGALAVCLLGVLAYQVRALVRRRKARVFGSKLTLRLVLWFALMAVLPGLVVYAVSVQFLAKSIESWFDVRVDTALEAGLNLGRGALENMLKELTQTADAMAASIAERPASEYVAALNVVREQAGVQEATVFNQRGQVLAFSGSERAGLMPEAPALAVLRQVRVQQAYNAVESIPERGLYLRAVVPVNALGYGAEVLALQLLHPVPRQLAADADRVQAGYRDYQELLRSRDGLQQLFALTLTLAFLLAVLAALALAFLISERLSAPLGYLAEGTRAVAHGDFSHRLAVASRDELGVLTQSFNAMTRQLEEARFAVERHQTELESAKAYLEGILANLSAGVLVLDEGFRLHSANLSAGAILGEEMAGLRDSALSEWEQKSPALCALAREALAAFQTDPELEWEKQVELSGRSGRRLLLLRGTRLPEAAQPGYLLVFDDITHLLQAQRYVAWGEVARRLAHEIKNPLTPIQLSAERLARKLSPKLERTDAEVLDRSTRTIVAQVTALKGMVDAFSQYAKLPGPKLSTLELNPLVREVAAMYESAPLVAHLDPRLPKVKGDAAQLRQVIHNLLQNAIDAVAGVTDAHIKVRTAGMREGVRFTVEDNGSGFAKHLVKRAFEPYVTTKAKGTGLGLAIVKKIVEEHRGHIGVENIQPCGARVSIVLPADEERKDP
jgi:nitrogen fixation/metabolism regulation signal transduction histidine kinase